MWCDVRYACMCVCVWYVGSTSFWASRLRQPWQVHSYMGFTIVTKSCKGAHTHTHTHTRARTHTHIIHHTHTHTCHTTHITHHTHTHTTHHTSHITQVQGAAHILRALKHYVSTHANSDAIAVALAMKADIVANYLRNRGFVSKVCMCVCLFWYSAMYIILYIYIYACVYVCVCVVCVCVYVCVCVCVCVCIWM